MNILALVPDAFENPGGIAEYNRSLFTALSKFGEVQKIVMVPQFTKVSPGGLPKKIFQKSQSPNKFIYAAKALATLLREGPFDLIVCGHVNFSPLCFLLKSLAGIPMWLLIFGIEAWKLPAQFHRQTLEQSALVISPSRHTRRKFLSQVRMDPTKVRILPPLLDDKFYPGPKPAGWIKTMGWENKKVMLAVGRLAASEAYKGQDRVLRAMPLLLKKISNLFFAIAGDGDDRPRLEKLAQDLKVAHAVQFLGRVEHETILSCYHAADLFVMPSKGEGFGIVFIEAAACGLPVISGASDGSVDALQEGNFGELSKDEDLADKIEDALRGKTPRGPDLARRVREVFGREAYEKQLKEILLVMTT